MKMTFRWYGEGNDTVTLKQIRQIPGVEGIVWALHDVPAGEEWPMDKILHYKKLADEYGLHIEVVESVNVHEDIKLGLPTRDQYIENYIEDDREAGDSRRESDLLQFHAGVRLDADGSVQGDGRRLDGALFRKGEDRQHGSAGAGAQASPITPDFTMPGWEPERLQAAGPTDRGVPERHGGRSVPQPRIFPEGDHSGRRSSMTSRWRSIRTIRRGRCSACRASSRTRTTSAACWSWWTAPTTASRSAAVRSARIRTTTSRR